MLTNFGWGNGARWMMQTPFMGQWGSFLPLIILWALFWKGLALWHAAKRGQNVWFIVLLVVNTLGILEIIYLFWVLKIKREELFK
mgnify:CR=1 FL=1